VVPTIDFVLYKRCSDRKNTSENQRKQFWKKSHYCWQCKVRCFWVQEDCGIAVRKNSLT